jgi:hypothetical protein
MLHLSYKGENLGEFDESQISLMISDGRIDQNAYFWRVGLEYWKPISDTSMLPRKRLRRRSPKKLLPYTRSTPRNSRGSIASYPVSLVLIRNLC